MTNEEKIICKMYLNDLDKTHSCNEYKLLMEMLEAQPSEDCISRQAVLDIITFEDKWLFDANGHNANTHIAFSGLESRVKALPSVIPQRPKGKWIECKSRFGVRYFKCSECGRKIIWIDRDDSYCNSCGSDNSESTKELYKEWDTWLAEMSGGAE